MIWHMQSIAEEKIRTLESFAHSYWPRALFRGMRVSSHTLSPAKYGVWANGSPMSPYKRTSAAPTELMDSKDSMDSSLLWKKPWADGSGSRKKLVSLAASILVTSAWLCCRNGILPIKKKKSWSINKNIWYFFQNNPVERKGLEAEIQASHSWVEQGAVSIPFLFLWCMFEIFHNNNKFQNSSWSCSFILSPNSKSVLFQKRNIFFLKILPLCVFTLTDEVMDFIMAFLCINVILLCPNPSPPQRLSFTSPICSFCFHVSCILRLSRLKIRCLRQAWWPTPAVLAPRGWMREAWVWTRRAMLRYPEYSSNRQMCSFLVEFTTKFGEPEGEPKQEETQMSALPGTERS